MTVNHFTPSIREIGKVPGVVSMETIEQETCLYSADPIFAIRNGGPLTLSIMKKLLEEVNFITQDDNYRYPIIDTRVHMLMPGQCPAIPGWHCDNVPRSSYNAQPDLALISPHQINYTVLIGSEENIAPTEFINREKIIPFNPEKVWGSVSDFINQNMESFWHDIISVEDGTILEFNGPTIHRATPATKRGWRFFFRMSFMSNPAQNKIRNQSMIYATEDMGW